MQEKKTLEKNHNREINNYVEYKNLKEKKKQKESGCGEVLDNPCSLSCGSHVAHLFSKRPHNLWGDSWATLVDLGIHVFESSEAHLLRPNKLHPSCRFPANFMKITENPLQLTVLLQKCPLNEFNETFGTLPFSNLT